MCYLYTVYIWISLEVYITAYTNIYLPPCYKEIYVLKTCNNNKSNNDNYIIAADTNVDSSCGVFFYLQFSIMYTYTYVVF